MNSKTAKLINKYARVSGQPNVAKEMKRVWDSKTAAEREEIRQTLERDIPRMEAAQKAQAAQRAEERVEAREKREAATVAGPDAISTIERASAEQLAQYVDSLSDG